MQNGIVRDGAYMRRLKDALYAQYGITALEITPASRGCYGETWKVCAFMNSGMRSNARRRRTPTVPRSMCWSAIRRKPTIALRGSPTLPRAAGSIRPRFI